MGAIVKGCPSYGFPALRLGIERLGDSAGGFAQLAAATGWVGIAAVALRLRLPSLRSGIEPCSFIFRGFEPLPRFSLYRQKRGTHSGWSEPASRQYLLRVASPCPLRQRIGSGLPQSLCACVFPRFARESNPAYSLIEGSKPSPLFPLQTKKGYPFWAPLFCLYGGEGGIRTLDGLLTHTPLAGERLQPLGHLSIPAGLSPAEGRKDKGKGRQGKPCRSGVQLWPLPSASVSPSWRIRS